MPRPDETFIVRVRRLEGDATVEQPRLSRQRQVQDIAHVGPLIERWLGTTSDDAGGPAEPRPREGSNR
jgi:hypothetical protein